MVTRIPGVRFPTWQDPSLCHHVRSGSRAHSVPYPMGTWDLPRIKRPWREADHSISSSVEVKNVWSFIFTPPYVCTAWRLVKQQRHLYLKRNKMGLVHDAESNPSLIGKRGTERPRVMGVRPTAIFLSLYLVAVVTTSASLSLSFSLQYRPHEAPNHTLLPVECCDQHAATVQHFSTCTATKYFLHTKWILIYFSKKGICLLQSKSLPKALIVLVLIFLQLSRTRPSVLSQIRINSENWISQTFSGTHTGNRFIARPIIIYAGHNKNRGNGIRIRNSSVRAVQDCKRMNPTWFLLIPVYDN
jgi:hypothetical protein